MEKLILKLKNLFVPCEENQYKPKILQSRFLYYYAGLLLLFKIFTISLFFYLPQSSFFADITKTSLLQLTNEARAEQGVGPLTDNLKLDEAALLKAQDMFNNEYFAHTSPSGVTPWFWFGQAGYNYKYAGENLAIGFVDSSEVNQAWLDSPSHRANLINGNYDEIGLAVLSGEFQGGHTTIVVQLFGTPRTRVPQTAVAGASEENTPPVQKIASAEKSPVIPETTTSEEEQTASEAVPVGNEIAQAGPPTSQSQPVQGQSKEVLSATSATVENNNMVRFLSFLTSDYNNLFQEILYGSLLFIALVLLSTVVMDVFVYRAYEIQYKDVFLKTLILCAVFLILFLVDKETIIQMVPHHLGIY